jgi:hypothetical protein
LSGRYLSATLTVMVVVPRGLRIDRDQEQQENEGQGGQQFRGMSRAYGALFHYNPLFKCNKKLA